jgi:hypothetical protein
VDGTEVSNEREFEFEIPSQSQCVRILLSVEPPRCPRQTGDWHEVWADCDKTLDVELTVEPSPDCFDRDTEYLFRVTEPPPQPNTSYAWSIDGHTVPGHDEPELIHTFTGDEDPKVTVVVSVGEGTCTLTGQGVESIDDCRESGISSSCSCGCKWYQVWCHIKCFWTCGLKCIILGVLLALTITAYIKAVAQDYSGALASQINEWLGTSMSAGDIEAAVPLGLGALILAYAASCGACAATGAVAMGIAGGIVLVSTTGSVANPYKLAIFIGLLVASNAALAAICGG